VQHIPYLRRFILSSKFKPHLTKHARTTSAPVNVKDYESHDKPSAFRIGSNLIRLILSGSENAKCPKSNNFVWDRLVRSTYLNSLLRLEQRYEIDFE
jgi:hypothetical protein